MAVQLLACDLDGTLAQTYVPLSEEMVEILQNFQESGRQVVVLTDEIEENIESRVVRFFREGTNLHVFSDGGSVGFGFEGNKKTVYYRKSFDRQQIQLIEGIVINILGEFRPEPDKSRNRYGVKVSIEPTTLQLEQLESTLACLGLQETMSYIGRGIFRFNPYGKHKALEYFLQLSDISEEDTILIADQTAKFRNDWRLFDRFRRSIRVHVGPEELMIDDDSVLHPGKSNEITTLDFLNQLRKELVIDESFYSNRRLYLRWINDIRDRTEINQLEIERKIRLNKPRHPILPEEQAIYLLPFLKRVIYESNSVPVIMARAMLPVADIIRVIKERNSLERMFEEPLVMKTASFEDMSDYNPTALARRDGLEGDFALSITINTFLGEEAFRILNDSQRRIRDREGLNSNNLGGLIQEIGPACIDEKFKRRLRRFYEAGFYQASFALYGEVFDAEIFLQSLRGLNERELIAIRSRIAQFNRMSVNEWETVWRINQEAVKSFYEINPITYRKGTSFDILKDLLVSSSFAGQYGSRQWIGLDDSQLTGRSSLLFRIIAEAVSPKQKHSFGIFSSTPVYGQDHSVDFVMAQNVLFPEKEPELYDGIYRINRREGILSYAFVHFDPVSAKCKKPNLQKVRESLADDYSYLKPFFRRDTSLDPFELIIFHYLTGGQDYVVNAVLEEYLPNRNENPHFLDLGARVIEFARGALPSFMRKVGEYRSSQAKDPFNDVDITTFRNHLYQTLGQEIKSKRGTYKQRQMLGISVIEENRGFVTGYLDDKMDFENLKRRLVPKVYAA